MTNKKCPRCRLVNFATDDVCRRCGSLLENSARSFREVESAAPRKPTVLKRALITLGVVALLLFAAYASLLTSSSPISYEQQQIVERAINIIEAKGFDRNAFVLRRFVSYRATDNWWNRWVGHADAYAATNFPFQVVTLYPDFFNLPVDDTERAAVLLHESFHLLGHGEEKAFDGVWRAKRELGWTKERYEATRVWRNVHELTMDYAPSLFQCGAEGHSDCTE
ncbi:MAG: hypothetical protein H0V88_02645 [Pyrinomonadaceae bacterium]|nr:hypothetical protein [Pyrinomonadaceae bacterium]